MPDETMTPSETNGAPNGAANGAHAVSAESAEKLNGTPPPQEDRRSARQKKRDLRAAAAQTRVQTSMAGVSAKSLPTKEVPTKEVPSAVTEEPAILTPPSEETTGITPDAPVPATAAPPAEEPEIAATPLEEPAVPQEVIAALRLRVKVWTDRQTGKRYLMPTADWRDVVNGQPVSDVMQADAMRDDDTKRVTLTAREWNALPFFYFREDGPAPRAPARPVDVIR